MLNKIVVFLRKINHADNRHQHQHREHERRQELLEDVFIE